MHKKSFGIQDTKSVMQANLKHKATKTRPQCPYLEDSILVHEPPDIGLQILSFCFLVKIKYITLDLSLSGKRFI